MRVDLHIHTSERSSCALSTTLEQLSAARDAGLGAVAITDHHRLVPTRQRREWSELFPEILLLPGIEITLDAEGEDILVVGLDDPRLERGAWSWPELHDHVREHGGLLVLAHPYRYQAEIGIDLESRRPDALEAYSPNVPSRHRGRIRQDAERLGLPVVANSDAHWASGIGAYANRLAVVASDAAQVVAAIREGRFTVETPDPIR
ncbi:MAG TPA: PHP-associated domain-containing protein [Candidatus Krumholzibacteria bacterium]|nr:PHP-associated domain-containing protein [Candidatus Krumholzibacteria bacterium]HPD70164.1 PHP-associated domain-containing protein [Candidatus Krumholzibacteria bacterium]HRY40136.1 PHP-associated domain-containing protein [Candidatus Krumholzibacteria bacterium]